MALLLIEGFDHYGTASPMTVGYQGKWTAGTSSGCSFPGRTGGCLRLQADSIYSKPLPVSGFGGVAGIAVYFGTTAPGDFLQFREGTGIVHMSVGLDSATQKLQVKMGTTVLAVGTTPLSQNSWYYIELKVFIDNLTGTYEVRVDGVPETGLVNNAGNVDTRNGGTGQWDRVLLTSANYTSYYDDLYVCDTSGPAPRNTFLGPCRVETLFPQTDAVAVGTNQGLTPVGTADHGNNVDEATPSTTDYNYSATVGVKDTYNFPALSLSGTIYGIQTNLLVAKSDAANRQVCAVVRTAGVDADGANVAPLTTFSYMSEIRQLNPNGGSPVEWTSGAVASMEAGMKVTV